MKELRNQVVVYFKTINRKYMDHHLGNTLLHMVCQEGYYSMLQFMLNPAYRSDLDTNDLEIQPKNMRNRTPLMLCFTPPSATVSYIARSTRTGFNNKCIPIVRDISIFFFVFSVLRVEVRCGV